MTGWEIAAAVLLFAGVGSAMMHTVAMVVALVQNGADDNRAESVPWGYMGVGLVLGFIAFYVSRGLSVSSWGAIDDLGGLIMVLIVASGGFGAAYVWTAQRTNKQIPWTLPLLMSSLLGATIGLAGIT